MIVDVCRSEGLQQVTWVSRRLSSAEVLAKFTAVRQQGNERYGEATPLFMPNAVHWLEGRVFVGIGAEFEGLARLVMFIRGEQYSRCSLGHEVETGHAAGMHVRELLQKNY